MLSDHGSRISDVALRIRLAGSDVDPLRGELTLRQAGLELGDHLAGLRGDRRVFRQI